MIPRLVRFYGGTPMQWLAEWPMLIVKAFTRQLPRLRAQESILASKRISIGTGAFKEEDARAITNEWDRDAAVDEAPAKPRTWPTPEELRARGLQVFGPTPAES